MFTGLVTDVGIIARIDDVDAGRELRVYTSFNDLVDGESVALNGVCLTVRAKGVEGIGQCWFDCAAVVTTLGRTTISNWRPGMRVNLERAMQLGDRLGGHIVLGHVDGVATVTRTDMHEDAWLLDVQLPLRLMPLMVDHGSIAIDGVSLTINALLPDGVQLSIIEYTKRHTALGDLVEGSMVNVEADVLAKHVERLLAPRLAMMQEST